MDTNLLILIIILVLVVSGFIFLGWTLRGVWNSLSQRKSSLFSRKINETYIPEPVSPEDCYDACMKKSGWDRSRARACAESCDL